MTTRETGMRVAASCFEGGNSPRFFSKASLTLKFFCTFLIEIDHLPRMSLGRVLTWMLPRMRFSVVNEQGKALAAFDEEDQCRKFIAKELETTVAGLKALKTRSRGLQKGETYHSRDRKKFRLIVETESLPTWPRGKKQNQNWKKDERRASNPNEARQKSPC